MDEEVEYALKFFEDGEGEIKDNEDVLNENRLSYKYLTKDGKAKAVFENGDEFEGSYFNLMREGKGSYVFAKQEGWTMGAKYEGEYKNDKKNGKGTFYYPDGSVYIGEWKEDEREGRGIYKYANGDIFRGFWKKGKKHGKGEYAFRGMQLPPAKILISAPKKQVQYVAKIKGATWLRFDSLITNEGNSSSDLGKEIKGYLEAKKPLPLHAKVSVVVKNIKKSAATGWVLTGFPCDLEEAKALADSGVSPDVAILYGESKENLSLTSAAQTGWATPIPTYIAPCMEDLEWAVTCILSSSVIQATWMNGSVVKQSNWLFQDGSGFFGSFLNNTPQGPGLFLNTSGITYRGSYNMPPPQPEEDEEEDQSISAIWNPVDLSTRPLPGPRAKLERDVRRARVRIDQNPKNLISDLDVIEGVPNLYSLDDGPPFVFGCGTPTLEGIENLVRTAQKEEIEAMFVIVTRVDPVAYLPSTDGETKVTGSYAPAMLSAPQRDLNMANAEEEKIDDEHEEEESSVFQQLEIQWAERLAREIDSSHGELSYMDEFQALQRNIKRIDAKAPMMCLTSSRDPESMELEEGQLPPPEIKCALKYYEELAEMEENEEEDEDQQMVPIDFMRIPMPDDSPPTSKSIDQIISALRDRNLSSEAVCFLNRKGSDSASFGVALTGLYYLVTQPKEEEEEEQEDDKDEDEDKELDEKEIAEDKPVEKTDNKESSSTDGTEVAPIKDILMALPEESRETIKTEVNAMAARCNQVTDLHKGIYANMPACAEAEAKAKTRCVVARYAMLLATHAYFRAGGLDEDAELGSFEEWLSATEQEGIRKAISSIEDFDFASGSM
ncbi:hypothetical protein AAMO2058_000525800 [Amorphochlora amoebiformis]